MMHSDSSERPAPRQQEGSSSETTQQLSALSESSPTRSQMTEAERQREQALREARQVMDTMGINQLDQFNLLGVIANPRGSQHGSAMGAQTPTAMSSAHGPTSVSSSAHSDTSSFLAFTGDTYHSLESTISQVTEQIEALNHVFEDWSRQYLNDYYYADYNSGADAVPESQLQELPPELTNLDLTSLQGYLQQTGVLAQTFQKHHYQQLLKKKRQEQQQQVAAAAASSRGSTISDTPEASSPSPSAATKSAEQLLDIPEIFFHSDFDLTDPRTFSELLLSMEQEGTAAAAIQMKSSSASSTTARQLSPSLEESTHKLFQIPPPEHFTGYLDKVEVALLEQVREKSEAFFQETNRFAQLKEWVGELLLDVQRIRGLIEEQARAIQSWQQVPQWDRKRKHLVFMERILEGSNEILRSKQCIGGLLSAKDDLGAVEQIQYARRLLSGVVEDDDDDVEGEENAETSSSQQQQGDEQRRPQHVMEKEAPIELGRLHALKPVGEQLNQYEKLVVNSLTEEVVEMFLEWNTSTLASVYGLSNGGMTSSSKSSSQQEIQRRTLNIIRSLEMCHAVSHMSQFYSTRLHDVVRMTVRTTVGEFASDASNHTAGSSVSVSVTAMSLERFIDCLDMLFEQLLALLTSAAGVDEFCQKEGLAMKNSDGNNIIGSNIKKNGGSSNNGTTDVNGISSDNDKTVTHSSQTTIGAIVASAAELSSKSIAELLRLRKEVHSLVSLEEIRRIWDTCMKFIEDVERLSGHKCVALRSMLLAQAKAFVERKHESNMSALVAALDSERWTQCEVSHGSNKFAS
jgi:vacuolar protein sorting-associated protein 54